MNRQEPAFRFYTPEAKASIIKKLNWPYESWMQDWPLEISDKIDIETSLKKYPLLENDDEKFLLMRGILYVLDAMQEDDFESYSPKIIEILKSDFHIHQYTIYYWTLYTEYPDESPLLKDDEIFRITPLMRYVWNFCNNR